MSNEEMFLIILNRMDSMEADDKINIRLEVLENGYQELKEKIV